MKSSLGLSKLPFLVPDQYDDAMSLYPTYEDDIDIDAIKIFVLVLKAC